MVTPTRAPYFAGSGSDSGPLHALSNAVANGNGVYGYFSGGGFPTNSYNSTNYWVDVVFNDTTPPVVTSTSPASNATNVAPGSVVTATFSEAVQASTISLVLTDASNNAVSASVTYDPATETVTLSPTSSLGYSTVYTATLSGAQDLAGNTITPVSWTFTTAADTTPPVVTATSPAANATNVAPGSVVTATFSEAVQASTISLVLTDASNNVVPASVSYDPVTETVTLESDVEPGLLDGVHGDFERYSGLGWECDGTVLMDVHDGGGHDASCGDGDESSGERDERGAEQRGDGDVWRGGAIEHDQFRAQGRVQQYGVRVRRRMTQ